MRSGTLFNLAECRIFVYLSECRKYWLFSSYKWSLFCLVQRDTHCSISTCFVLCCPWLGWCANKAAHVISRSPCSFSASISSLIHGWMCAEHTSPNQNGFIAISFWEKYTCGANLANLGVYSPAVGRKVWPLYPKQAHSNAGMLQGLSIGAQKRRQSFALELLIVM